MPFRCSKCGSLNVDGMAKCGKCGTPLSETDRLELKPSEDSNPDYGEIVQKCPYCGRPMEEGTLEVPQGYFAPRWIGQEASEPIGFGTYSVEFEGYRCTTCNCMLVTY